MVQGRGDCWPVCLPGGEDGYTLLAALYELKWRGLLPVDGRAAGAALGGLKRRRKR